ncbi:sigma 54-interacting transcriptional regulator [Anaerophilus nitritogenes]|uniref:sigma 54-interacting transcriptional regulator n=1 Tax=Anaerophilus nitritogenes TaxID=2498136 RepID=UPI001FA9C3A8|nr:sigma 54-interacting transcriptional regulator [Anaerophilus nitritogenes]
MKVKDYTIYSPLSIAENKSLDHVKALFENNLLDFIPIVDQQHHVQNIVSRNSIYELILDQSLPFDSMDELIQEKFVMVEENDHIEKILPIIDQNIIVVDHNKCFKGFIQKDKIIKDYFHNQQYTNLKIITQALENERNATEILKTIIDKAYEGIIVVDENGYITMINTPYAEFLERNKEDIIGKHATEIIDTTRLHIVVKTGKEELGEVQKVRGKNIVVMRVPIYKEGKVVGAIGKIMFKDIQEVNVLASRVNQMENELKYYKNALKEVSGVKYSFENIIGVSDQLKETKFVAEKATHTNSNVLIRGDSGTGKELFAHAIHAASNRVMGPFVKVNCAAIPAELLESELFGYEEGAFTGAKKGGKIGKFEMANGGSIFLDEIGDMPHSMQSKLLRVLQEKEVERIGGMKNIPLDVRIIAATNRNLEKMVKNGEFREDLYYRLNVMSIYIPSLSERIDDLEPLIYYLLQKISEQVGNYVTKISQDAMNHLKNHSWPGNVRELENVLERAINLVDYGKQIEIEHLPMNIRKIQVTTKTRGDKDLKQILDEVEKEVILDCLNKVNGNRTKAAKNLNISRSSLYEKLWKYGIE